MASERMRDILKRVDNRVQQLTKPDRFYVVLFDAKGEQLEFAWVAWRGKPVRVGRAPWKRRAYQGVNLLPDIVIAQGETMLFEEDLATEIAKIQAEYWPDSNPPLSWLGVPIVYEQQVLGALVVENKREPRAFGDSVDVLTTIAGQTAVAIERVRLDERLERKIADLRTVNEVGRRLTSGIRLDEAQILELIYEQASRLMDTSDVYIALYDPDPSRPDDYNPEAPEKSVIHGTVRFGLAMDDGRRVDTQCEKGWQPRKAGHGLTEYVIRTKKAYRPADVEQAYRTIARDYIGEIPKSWMGVPMVVENQVLGVVVLRKDEYANAYTDDDEEVLQAIAGQAAVAIENAGLYQELKAAQSEIADKERGLVTSSLAMDFIHKMNNLAGTIVPWITLVKRELSPETRKNPKVVDYLGKIARDTELILKEAQEMRTPLTRPEKVNLEELIGSIVGEAQMMTSAKIEFECDPDIPPVYAIELQLSVAIYSVIENAVRATFEKGQISIKVRCKGRGEDRKVQIIVIDTGCGIPEDKLMSVFDYGTSYWADGRGTGYGLWRARSLIRGMGGKIIGESIPGEGSTFTITLPVEPPSLDETSSFEKEDPSA
jgi:two-component system sensor histidine kinase HydH